MKHISDFLFEEYEKLTKGEVSVEHAKAVCEIASEYTRATERLITIVTKEVDKHG